MSTVILVLALSALIAAVAGIVQWIRSDGDPSARPQPRPQEDWSDLPTHPYATR